MGETLTLYLFRPVKLDFICDNSDGQVTLFYKVQWLLQDRFS